MSCSRTQHGGGRSRTPCCLALRVVTIVSDKSQQRDRLDQLKSFLRKQNYPETLIENGIDRAIKKGPITGDGTKNKENVIPLVTTFNPCNTNVLPFIRGCEKKKCCRKVIE